MGLLAAGPEVKLARHVQCVRPRRSCFGSPFDPLSFASKRERVDSGPPDRYFFCARFWRESVRRGFLEEERWLFVVCDPYIRICLERGKAFKTSPFVKGTWPLLEQQHAC